ncbi:MAG TPA: hypothetical protein VF972_03980, partial [Actinomycetota bacterium]
MSGSKTTPRTVERATRPTGMSIQTYQGNLPTVGADRVEAARAGPPVAVGCPVVGVLVVGNPVPVIPVPSPPVPPRVEGMVVVVAGGV